MAIFYSDSASINSLSITGSLNISGSFSGTASLAVSASYALSSSVSVSSSFSSTSSVATSASYALSSSTSISSSFSSTSSVAVSASYALSSSTSISSSFSSTSSVATSASFANTASFVNNIMNLINTGSLATTGSNTFIGDQVVTGSLILTNNLTVLGSSSITYITSSQLDVSTNIISVNTATPAIRFGGLAVIDSGSFPQTSGSILFDSLNDQWVFIHQGTPGGVITSSVFIQGPQTFNNVGNEITILPNRLTKGTVGDLGEHITSSNITDTGLLVSINSNTEIIGSLTASNGITSSLLGTSSWAVNSLSSSFSTSSSFASSSISASFALSSSRTISASFALTSSIATSSSFASSSTSASFSTTSSFASTSSFVNPLSQSVVITGSLTVISGSSIELQVTNIGTKIGSAITDTHTITGSLTISGSTSGSFSGSFSGSYVGNGAGLTGITATAAPAGPNTSIQFNDNGATSGSGTFQFDKATNNVVLTGSLFVTGSNTAPVQYIWLGTTVTATGTQWTNQPLATASFGTATNLTVSSSHYIGDFTTSTQCRLFTSITTVGVGATSSLIVQYSTDNVTWVNFSPSISMGTLGLRDSGWAAIPAASRAFVYIRLIGYGGNGTADPTMSPPILLVR